MAEKNRPLSQDLDYINSQIDKGFEVVVDGTLYNRTNRSKLPTQQQLDGEEPLPPAKSRLQPRNAAAERKAAEEKAAEEKAAAEKAEADKAEAEKAAADKAAADKAEAEKKAAAKSGK